MSIAFNSGFANNLNDAQGRKDAAQKTTALPFRDYLAPTTATTPDKNSFVPSIISGKVIEFAPDTVVSGHKSDGNGFAQAMEQMLGMAQGTPTAGISDITQNSLESKAVATKQIASPFKDSLSALGAHSAEKANKVSASVVKQAAEFDPFSVVRSGAVPEDNAFVLALKRLYGLMGDPSPVPENTDTTTVNAAPVAIETVQAKPVSVDLPPSIDHSPEPISGLSQLISDALEQSAVTSANQEVMDTVLNKLS